MKSIVDRIKEIPNLYHLDGCKTNQIKTAQNKLDLIFSDEFIDYVKAYGIISFYGTEWTGLNVDGYLNVVEATKAERENDSKFPKDCIVLENIAIDGILTILDSKGNIYAYQSGKEPVLICNSMTEYLDICIQRNESK